MDISVPAHMTYCQSDMMRRLMNILSEAVFRIRRIQMACFHFREGKWKESSLSSKRMGWQ